MSSINISSDRPSTTPQAAPSLAGAWRKLVNARALLCLALPLALAVGCASAPKSPPAYSHLGAEPTAPVLTERQTADWVISQKIYLMFMADKGINYPLCASVRDGVVSMSGTSFDGVERQRIVNGMWALDGVTEVKNEQGKDVAPTVPVKPVVLR